MMPPAPGPTSVRWRMRLRVRSRSLRVAAWMLLPGALAPASARAFDRLADGVALSVGDKRVEVRVCRDDIVRVLYAPPGAFFARKSIVTVADACASTAFDVKTGPQ